MTTEEIKKPKETLQQIADREGVTKQAIWARGTKGKAYYKAYHKSDAYKAYHKAYYLKNREKILAKLKQKYANDIHQNTNLPQGHRQRLTTRLY